jgi:hypothetical protein
VFSLSLADLYFEREQWDEIVRVTDRDRRRTRRV